MKNYGRTVWDRYCGLWHELRGAKLFLFYALHYTVLFAVLWKLVTADFAAAGKTYIWYPDTMSQMFAREVYLSQTLRNGIQSLLSGDGWTVPLYDFRLGLAKLDMQVEPVEWLTVLCPWDEVDRLFDFLVVLRVYLIGLSFSAFGFYFRQKALPVLIGAVSYCFCGYVIRTGIYHPSFMTPMMLLPLLVVGAEKVLRRERPYLLTAVVFLALTSYLYFACMMAILLAIYVLVRFPSLYEKDRLRAFAAAAGRLAAAVGTGAALSGVVLLPTMLQMAGTGRIGKVFPEGMSLLNYGAEYYADLLANYLVSPETSLGFPVLTVPALIMLFSNRNRANRTLRWMFLILTVMLMVPAVAYVMSGFNTPNNRWSFGYSFCCAAVLMFELPRLLEADRRVMSAVIVGTVAYFLVCYFLIGQGRYKEEPFVLLAAALLVVVCLRYARVPALLACLAVTCLGIWYGFYRVYDPGQGNGISQYENSGAPYMWYERSQYGAFARAFRAKTDDGLYRVGGDNITVREVNASFYEGINGLACYSSIHYESVFDWYKEMEMSTTGQNIAHYGIVGRAPMLTLAGMKYYVLKDAPTAVKPYGFTEVDRIESDEAVNVILENRYALPFGYTYDSFISRDSYDALSGLGKTEAQLQAVVLDGTPRSQSITEADVETTAVQVPVTVTDAEKVRWGNGVLEVLEDNATATLVFEGIPETETYLRVVNLDLADGGNARRWYLRASTDTAAVQGYFTADAYTYSNGQKTQLFDLGYTEEGCTSVTVKFRLKGTYILDDLQIWCQPMDRYGEQIDALRAEALEDVETNWRGLTGHISVSRDKMLCIAVPYDTGWSAYVDGEKTELFRANTAFMAVELPAGEHTVELKYWTPGLTGGLVLTAIGLCGLACLIILRRKEQ